MTLESSHPGGVTRERHDLHDIALLAQPRQQLVGQLVRARRVGQKHGLAAAGHSKPADLLVLIDGDDASGHPALLIDPLADLLGADFRGTEPRRLLGDTESEHGVPIIAGGRTAIHRREATEGVSYTCVPAKNAQMISLADGPRGSV